MSRRAVLVCALAWLLVAEPFAGAEPFQSGNLRVFFTGTMRPSALPREGYAPISVGVKGTIVTTDGSQPPALEGLSIAINREGRLDTKGIPSCSLDQIQPATTENALKACRSSLVGEGTFAASVAIPEQSPFPSQGRLLAFNGRQHGKPVIFAHVYGTEPVPTSLTLPFRISRSQGTYGTTLTTSLPEVSSNIAFVTGITLKLGRRFHRGGRTYGYLSSGCPAAKGFPGATFSLLRAAFSFSDGRVLRSVLSRSCHALG